MKKVILAAAIMFRKLYYASAQRNRRIPFGAGICLRITNW